MKLKREKKYSAYTLLELLVVISIFIILGGMTFAAFDGLQSTVKMNEYMLNLEQDIRSVQRAAMLLQRNPGEDWIFGLGIDFTDTEEDGTYRTFKWCSPFQDYGDARTKSNIPGFYGGTSQQPDTIRTGNGYLPSTNYDRSLCMNSVEILRTLPGYEKNVTLPKADITFGSEARYILFESVSGRTFFYDSAGTLLNYESNGDMLDDIVSFQIIIDPVKGGKTRILNVRNLSGKIDTYIYNENQE